MEDLQEYEVVKKHQEKRKNGVDSSNTLFARPEESMISSFKHNREMIYERIGYNPTPRNPQWIQNWIFVCKQILLLVFYHHIWFSSSSIKE